MDDDDIISVSPKFLVVSEAAPEREFIRRIVSDAPVAIEVMEVAAAGDVTATCEALACDTYDVVFLDSRMPRKSRQTAVDAIHAANGQPLAILVGPAKMKTREVLDDGLPIDGTLAKPLDAQELSELIRKCVRARTPSRTLLVDDSATARAAIRKELQASRFRLDINEAPDAMAAIALARRQKFDVAFLDYHLPGLDGIALMGELKRAHPDTKVALITGSPDVQIEDFARNAGASDFIRKPFYVKDVDAAITRFFGLMPSRWSQPRLSVLGQRLIAGRARL